MPKLLFAVGPDFSRANLARWRLEVRDPPRQHGRRLALAGAKPRAQILQSREPHPVVLRQGGGRRRRSPAGPPASGSRGPSFAPRAGISAVSASSGCPAAARASAERTMNRSSSGHFVPGFDQDVGGGFGIAHSQIPVRHQRKYLGRRIVADQRGLPGADRFFRAPAAGVAGAQVENPGEEVWRGAHGGAEFLRGLLDRAFPVEREPTKKRREQRAIARRQRQSVEGGEFPAGDRGCRGGRLARRRLRSSRSRSGARG